MSDVYMLPHEKTQPYTSGRFYREFTLDEMRSMSAELTEEEKKDPFFKYYSEELAPYQEDHLRAQAAGPLAPEECYMPDKAGNILLCENDKYAENGYGVLPNGVGFAAYKIDQIGITDEMIVNYRENFAHTENRNLFYKIWFPHQHVIHFEDAIIENWGWGNCFQDMNMSTFRFSHLGITKEEIAEKDPNCLSFFGIGGTTIQLDRPEREPWMMWMIMHTRKTSWGREMRVRYWNGIDFKEDGTIEIMANPDREETMKEMRMMMMHGQREYGNELKLMKQFWEDCQNK